MEYVKKHVLFADNVIKDSVQCLALKTSSLKNITYLLYDLLYKLFIYFLFYLRVKVTIYHEKFILCAYIAWNKKIH